MIMKVIDHQLTDEDRMIDQVDLKKGAKRNQEKLTTLVIRGTGTPSFISTRNVYIAGQNLAHLILGRDGSTIIQTTAFDRRAGARLRFETTAIIISLVNVGYLFELDNQRSHWRHKDNFFPQERLFARGTNDYKQRQWPCYPDDQLDLLLNVVEALMVEYKNLREVKSYEEIRTDALQPGPAFPMHTFIERLRLRIPDLINKKMVTRKTSKAVPLLNAPMISSDQFREDPKPITGEPVAAGTAVSAIEESDSWSLVEVLGDSEGPWLKGWLPTEELETTAFEARINEDPVLGHMLETQDKAAFPFIRAGNGNFNARKDSNKPKYLVMHLTTGTQIQSTINHFRGAGSGVSTHLVIGRDGRVIQMVPFNYAAYHSGIGAWEGDDRINYKSIGIELDNAGRVSLDEKGNWVKRKHIIPADRVKLARHRSDPVDRHYEDYTPIQLETAKRVAQALVKKYELIDIIGHDDISPDRRYDPGPCFPMKEWRKDLFGREEALITKHISNAPLVVYKDVDGRPPRLNHPVVKNIKLRNNQLIQIVDRNISDDYTIIKVEGVPGWVKSEFIKPVNDKFKIFTEEKVVFYQLLNKVGPPPVKLTAGSQALLLPLGTEVQILDEKLGLARIKTLTRLGTRFVSGWVDRDGLDLSE